MQATPTVGVTHDMVLGGLGLMTLGVPTRSDITQAIPRVSIGTDERKHTDLSEQDTFSQSTWHHGRGQTETFDDPTAFSDADHFITWIPNKLIVALEHIDAPKTGGSDIDFDGHASSIIPFAGNLFVLIFGNAAANNALYLWNNTNSELDVVAAGLDTSSGEPNQLHAFDEELYVAQGETVSARHFDGVSTWTDLGVPARFFVTFGSNDTNFLWRADNLNELYFSPDPDNDATAFWNGPLLVGDTTYPIRGMLAGFQGALWVIKDDGVYAVTYDNNIADFFVQKVIDLSSIIDSNNGKAIIEFGGNLFFTVKNTLYRYDGSSIQVMGPDRGQPESLTNRNTGDDSFNAGNLGKIVSLAHDENYLYASTEAGEGVGSRVMLWNGTGWHSLHQTSLSTADTRGVFFTSAQTSTGVASYPLLWWTNSDGDTIIYQKQSRFSVDPTEDTTLNYHQGQHQLITSWYDTGLPDIEKNFSEFLGEFQMPSSSDRFKVEFQTDNDETWRILEASLEGMVHKILIPIRFPDFPQEDVIHGITARRIRYRITVTVANDNLTVPRIISSWGHRFVVRPIARYGWSMTLKCYENMTLLDGSKEVLTSQELRNLIYSLRENKQPLRFDDGLSLPPAANDQRTPSFQSSQINTPTLGEGWGLVNAPTTAFNGQYKVFGSFSQEIDATTDDAVDRGIIGFTLGTSTGTMCRIYAHVYVPASTDTFYLQMWQSGAVVAEVAMSPSTDGSRFVRFTVSAAVTPSSLVQVRIIRKAGEHLSSKQTVYVDGVELYYSDSRNPWFTDLTSQQPVYVDGDQPRCFWLTPEDRNGSLRQEGYFVYITGISEALRYDEIRPGKRVSNSEITVSLREVGS